MVGEYQCFAENGLPVPVRYACVESVDGSATSAHIASRSARNARTLFDQARGAGRRGRLWPISFRQCWRLVLRVAAELENVPLGDAQVLQQLPAEWAIARAASPEAPPGNS